MPKNVPDPGPEVRLARLLPAEIEAALGRAPVAWIPLGALEFHAPHLPNGTDGITGEAVLVRAARRAGGVVLPWSYLTMGTLALPWSFRYEPALVAEALRQTLRQLPAFGVRMAVVHTGHGPLDLNHLIKRVCREVEAEGIGLRAIGLCYLELNAALGTGLATDWPVTVDHGSTMETSWVAAIEPDLVRLDRLPDDPGASIVGVYGPNPRFSTSAGTGGAQIDAAAVLLARRVTGILEGLNFDPLADLRSFVELYWPERLVLGGRAGSSAEGSGAVIQITNPAPVSRYLSGCRVRLDGEPIGADGVTLVNRTAGETGIPFPVATLGPEHGFYVRRLQTADLRLPRPVAPGPHRVVLALDLAGVSEAVYDETVAFT
ncbi:MAG TPA: creatininase family protein [Candidatus Sulfomarinibacteraceae bacterium]|nr:creatininase family protein [Candidatus Sulfomarinibacteraceae bacterium]